MHNHKLANLLAFTCLLAAGSPTLADDIVFERFEHKSSRLENVVDEALLAAVEKACDELMPAGGSADERRAAVRARSQAVTRAKQLVQYELLDGPRARPGAPGYVVMRAVVDRAALLNLYEAAKAKAADAPRYKVMVLISEQTRFIRPEPTFASWERSPQSKVAVAIASKLTDAGWDVVDGEQFEEIRKRQIDFSRLAGEDARIVQRIAAEQGAQIIVRGHAKAEGPNVRRIAATGRIHHFWSVDVTLSVCWSDTAIELFSIPLPDGEREAAHEVGGGAGAARALEKAGRTVAQEFLDRMASVAPRQELAVRIHGVDDFAQETEITDWVKSIGGVDSVYSEFISGMLLMQVRTGLTASEFASALGDACRRSGSDYVLGAKERRANSLVFELRAR